MVLNLVLGLRRSVTPCAKTFPPKCGSDMTQKGVGGLNTAAMAVFVSGSRSRSPCPIRDIFKMRVSTLAREGSSGSF